MFNTYQNIHCSKTFTLESETLNVWFIMAISQALTGSKTVCFNCMQQNVGKERFIFSNDSECLGLIFHGNHGQNIKEYYFKHYSNSQTTSSLASANMHTNLCRLQLIFLCIIIVSLNIGYNTHIIMLFYLYYNSPLIGNMNKQSRCLFLHWTQNKPINPKWF